MYMRWREPTRELIIRPASAAPEDVRSRALPPARAAMEMHSLVDRNPQALRKLMRHHRIHSVSEITRLLRSRVLILVVEPCRRMPL